MLSTDLRQRSALLSPSLALSSLEATTDVQRAPWRARWVERHACGTADLRLESLLENNESVARPSKTLFSCPVHSVPRCAACLAKHAEKWPVSCGSVVTHRVDLWKVTCVPLSLACPGCQPMQYHFVPCSCPSLL